MVSARGPHRIEDHVPSRELGRSHAVGEQRPAGLVAAESYAVAALCFAPTNQEALNLLNDIERTMEEEAQPWPIYKKALVEFDEYAFQPFDCNLNQEAGDLETEAQRQNAKGRFHLALPLTERALHLRIQTVGKAALQTYRVQLLKANILTSLGRFGEALPIAQAVVEAEEASPALGPNHLSTLETRYLVALILDRVGRSEEALPIAQAVMEAEEASPALGSDHPYTLAARGLVAEILDHLGRFEEALPIAQAVVERKKQAPALGPDHPYTLAARGLMAQILDHLNAEKSASTPQEGGAS